MSITIESRTHRRTTTVRPRPDGTVSPRAWRRVWRELCGVEGCGCVYHIEGHHYHADHARGSEVIRITEGDWRGGGA